MGPQIQLRPDTMQRLLCTAGCESKSPWTWELRKDTAVARRKRSRQRCLSRSNMREQEELAKIPKGAASKIDYERAHKM
jgi:hypothetical protein